MVNCHIIIKLDENNVCNILLPLISTKIVDCLLVHLDHYIYYKKMYQKISRIGVYYRALRQYLKTQYHEIGCKKRFEIFLHN